MVWLAGHLANLPTWGTLTVSRNELDMAPGGKPVEPPPPPADAAELIATPDRNAAEARVLAATENHIEHTSARAFPQLNAKANPGPMEDDWIVNFFGKFRIVSDNERRGRRSELPVIFFAGVEFKCCR